MRQKPMNAKTLSIQLSPQHLKTDMNSAQNGQGFFMPRRGANLSDLNHLYSPRTVKAKAEDMITSIKQRKSMLQGINTEQDSPPVPRIPYEKLLSMNFSPNQTTVSSSRKLREGHSPEAKMHMLMGSAQSPKTGCMRKVGAAKSPSRVKFSAVSIQIQPDGQVAEEKTLKKGVIKELNKKITNFASYG